MTTYGVLKGPECPRPALPPLPRVEGTMAILAVQPGSSKLHFWTSQPDQRTNRKEPAQALKGPSWGPNQDLSPLEVDL